MSISHWTNPTARAAYEEAYAASLELWPIPWVSRVVETPFGATHVVTSGAPGGDPIVLVHAAALTAAQWYLQAEALGSDHRLYAVDIMGDIGLSTQARPIHSRAEAAGWLGGVAEGLGLDRAIFVGSSFGGFQSTNLAVHRPDLVRGLVLLSPAATIKPFKLLANLMIRSGSLVPMPFTVQPGLRGMMAGRLPDERIVRQMEVGVAGFRYDRRGVYPSEIPDRELAAVACPTLLVLGTEERIYNPTLALARAHRLIPDLEAALLDGVGHLPGLQLPDVTNARIRSFLDSHFPGSRPTPDRLAAAPAMSPVEAVGVASGRNQEASR
jgi:pimeloyl-ACP methyl ester carboxylesterase